MKAKDWCMYCGECSGVCPRNLIEVKETSIIFSKEECKDCRLCMQACPIRAIEPEE